MLLDRTLTRAQATSTVKPPTGRLRMDPAVTVATTRPMAMQPVKATERRPQKAPVVLAERPTRRRVRRQAAQVLRTQPTKPVTVEMPNRGPMQPMTVTLKAWPRRLPDTAETPCLTTMQPRLERAPEPVPRIPAQVAQVVLPQPMAEPAVLSWVPLPAVIPSVRTTMAAKRQVPIPALVVQAVMPVPGVRAMAVTVSSTVNPTHRLQP